MGKASVNTVQLWKNVGPAPGGGFPCQFPLTSRVLEVFMAAQLSSAPRFSILIPTYNQANFLPQAVDSLKAQTVGDWEAVIVNDGSSDNTATILQEMISAEPRLRVYHQKNGGCAAALNTALRHARGEWITWLSSDDLFEADKLAVHLDAIASRPDIRFFYSHFYYLIEATGEKTTPELWRPIPEDWQQVSHFFRGNYIHGNSICIHRSCFDVAGEFDESSRQGQDFDMWLRLSARFQSLFIPRRTCVTRWHSGQTTNTFPEAGFFDSTRACIAFLNNSSFPMIFPRLDLTRLEDMARAIQETIAITCDPDALLYKCGPTSALFDRFAEWLSMDCPRSVRAALLEAVTPAIFTLIQSMPRPLALSAKRLLSQANVPRPYVPHSFIELLVQEITAVNSTNKARAIDLRRYLARIDPQRKTPARKAPFDVTNP